jgi:hypothetical protein
VAGSGVGWLVADGEIIGQNAGQVIANCVENFCLCSKKCQYLLIERYNMPKLIFKEQ